MRPFRDFTLTLRWTSLSYSVSGLRLLLRLERDGLDDPVTGPGFDASNVDGLLDVLRFDLIQCLMNEILDMREA